MEDRVPQVAVESMPWDRYVHRINYSADNEDSSTELDALDIGRDSRLVCIAAGGGRVLDLLVRGPREIWAVDLNPCQCHLLELKIAAIRSLDHAEYSSFMGIGNSFDRRHTFEKVRPRLSPDARDYFGRNRKQIRRGILLQGNLERSFGLVARIVQLPMFRDLRRLFAFHDLDEQRRFLDRKWTSFAWRNLLRTLCHKTFLGLFVDDPGFMRFLPGECRTHEAIPDHLHRYLYHNLARDNPLFSLMLTGGYVHEPVIPRYLSEEHFDDVRRGLERAEIRILNGTLQDVLSEAPPATFDGYSISDISSYMDQPAFLRILDEIIRTARPGAKVCARKCLVPLTLPEAYAERIRRDPEREARYARHDHAMVHEFLVGEVR